MKKLNLAAAAALVCAAVAIGPAHAQVIATTPVKESPALTGDIVRVQAAEGWMTIHTADNRDVRVRILPGSRILLNNRVVKLGDLPDRVPVRVMYNDRDGVLEATSIVSPVVAAPLPPAKDRPIVAERVPAPPVAVPAAPVAVPAVVAAGSVRGIVVEGDRPQPDLGVILRTQTGDRVIASIRTNADGTFRFTNILPGTYVVNADKVASQTRGETLVTIKAGQTLDKVVVNLVRPPLP